MTMLQKREMEKVLKKFNDDELGGGFLYFIHQNELIQMDLVDYSTCIICQIQDIESIQFVEEDDDGQKVDGIFIKLKKGIYEFVDCCWIDEMGCQM